MIRKIFATLAILVLASPAWSYTITGDIDVGNLDTIVGGTTDLNALGDCGNGSREGNEECWAENLLNDGTDLTYGTKDETVDFYVTNEDSSVIAFELSDGVGYYIVKNAQGYILLDNQINLGYGVLDLDATTAYTTFDSTTETYVTVNGSLRSILNLCDNSSSTCGSNVTISHVTPFDGDETKVPEPTPLALLGLGLLGLALTRSRALI